MEVKNALSLVEEIAGKIHQYHIPQGAELSDMYSFCHKILAFCMQEMNKANEKVPAPEENKSVPVEPAPTEAVAEVEAQPA